MLNYFLLTLNLASYIEVSVEYTGVIKNIQEKKFKKSGIKEIYFGVKILKSMPKEVFKKFMKNVYYLKKTMHRFQNILAPKWTHHLIPFSTDFLKSLVWWYFFEALVFISWMTNDVEIFSCCFPPVCSLLWNICSSFALFQSELFVLCLTFESSMFILSINPLSRMWFANIFFQYAWLSILFDGDFCGAKAFAFDAV